MSNVSGHKRTAHEISGPAEGEAPLAGRPVVYETSAGGVVLRHIRGTWQVALIEPNIINADTLTRRSKARPEGTVFALPKGGVDEGETPEQSAAREVHEETGVKGQLLFRLTTIRYVYVRSWGGREQVSKAVSFYLFLYSSGRLGQITPEMRDEVRRAFWFPLDKAHRKLTYRGEREVLKLAQQIVRDNPERLTPPPPVVISGPAVPRPAAQQRSGSQRMRQREGYSAPRGAHQPREAHPPRDTHHGQPAGNRRGGATPHAPSSHAPSPHAPSSPVSAPRVPSPPPPQKPAPPQPPAGSAAAPPFKQPQPKPARPNGSSRRRKRSRGGRARRRDDRPARAELSRPNVHSPKPGASPTEISPEAASE